MGFPIEVFLDPPDEEWICAICHEVFKNPVVTACGHSFCHDCLLESLDQRIDSCPTCRARGLCLTRSESGNNNCYEQRAFENYILKSKVQCAGRLESASDDNEDGTSGPPAARRRRLNNGAAVDTTKTLSPSCCTWTGKLGDLEQHRENECEWTTIECSVADCTHCCRRGEIRDHMIDNLQHHMELMVEAETAVLREEFQSKLKEMETRHQQDLVERHINSFCQQWIRGKPDPLYDFCVYRQKFAGEHSPRFNKLLIGIPGPLNTPWEGGLFPLVMEWEKDVTLPPRCTFPPRFYHLNVFPTGKVAITTLHTEECWSPLTTVPEILFSIQRLLSHPNLDNPAQHRSHEGYTRDPCIYHDNVRVQAQHFSANSDFLANAIQAFAGRQELLSMEPVNDGNPLNVRDSPIPRPVLPETKGNCKCSCCAWSNGRYWDSSRNMRFVYGC